MRASLVSFRLAVLVRPGPKGLPQGVCVSSSRAVTWKLASGPVLGQVAAAAAGLTHPLVNGSSPSAVTDGCSTWSGLACASGSSGCQAHCWRAFINTRPDGAADGCVVATWMTLGARCHSMTAAAGGGTGRSSRPGSAA